MKKIVLLVVLIGILVLIACTSPAPQATPGRHPQAFLTASEVPPITPLPSPTLAGQLATITVALDMGSGGAGFAATIYAQEVYTGQTFHGFMSAGMHGLAVLPTSPPISFPVIAPGTYVFYARLINAPDDYHFGATRCGPATDCPDSTLIAVDVEPGKTYHIYIADPAAVLPPIDQPVTVPWTKGP